MPSSFTWLDYSEYERQKMADVIALFREKSTRDELGLGSVRDVFADKLFPGTSTIQTRAKYFLFVPWAFRSLEESNVSSAKAKKRLRKLEVKLIHALLECEDQNGLIGRQAKETLQRFPSSIYWQGLREWGIRLFDGSEAEYRKALDSFYIRRRGYSASADEFDGETRTESIPANWDVNLPLIPEDFPENQTLNLKTEQAEYLREKILMNCSESMLAFLLSGSQQINTSWAWDLKNAVSDDLKAILENGQNFSEAMHGSQLLYNLMLAEKRGAEGLVADYRTEIEDWWEVVCARESDLIGWNVEAFWRFVYSCNPKISHRAKRFITSWIVLIQEADQLSFVDEQPARLLVEQREHQLKRKLSRLSNVRALELWGGRAGADQLDLRWRSARTIVSDILEGIGAVGETSVA